MPPIQCLPACPSTTVPCNTTTANLLRTVRARRLAASCAGPGRVFLMMSRCFASCSSSLRILSSRLRTRRCGGDSEPGLAGASRGGEGEGGRRCRAQRSQRQPGSCAPVTPRVELVNCLINCGGRLRLLLGPENPLHVCSSGETRQQRRRGRLWAAAAGGCDSGLGGRGCKRSRDRLFNRKRPGGAARPRQAGRGSL